MRRPGRRTRLRVGLRLTTGLAAARVRRRPFILSHLVTSRCDARCATCLWRGAGDDDLPLDKIVWLYEEAAGAGLVQLVVWGGEPLLRDDLPALLRAAVDAGLVVTLISNGSRLAARWPELRGLVDALILSVDDGPAAHDLMRGLPGLSARQEEAVALIRRDPLAPRLLVNTVLSRLNPGALERVAPIARRWNAGWYVCPMETGRMLSTGFEPARDDLALAPRELSEAATTALTLRRGGYPLLASGRYLRMLQADPGLSAYRCRVPRAILTVEADGSVRDCRRRDAPLASVSELKRSGGRLSDVYRLPRYRAVVREAETCTSCNNPDVLETSWLWDLHPVMAVKMWRLLRG